LQWVEEHPSVIFSEETKGKYICPICEKYFEIEDTKKSKNNYLTLEDIPPKSMGGNANLLTCKDCNSKAGSKLDAELLKVFEKSALINFKPNSSGKIKLSNGDIEIDSTIDVNSDGVLNIRLNKKMAHPFKLDYLKDRIELPNKKVYDLDDLNKVDEYFGKLNIKIDKNVNLKRSKIALLRIGYLSAFQRFGYGFMVNPNLESIREQIQNPDKEILTKPFWLKNEWPDYMIGTNIIFKPKRLLAYLEVFKLKTNNFESNFGIILPGIGSPGLEAYDYINDVLCVGDGSKMCNIEMEQFQNRSFISKKEDAYACHKLWNYCKYQKNQVTKDS